MTSKNAAYKDTLLPMAMVVLVSSSELHEAFRLIYPFCREAIFFPYRRGEDLRFITITTSRKLHTDIVSDLLSVNLIFAQ